MGASGCLADTTVWALDNTVRKEDITALGGRYTGHFSPHDPPHFCIGSTVTSPNYKVR